MVACADCSQLIDGACAAHAQLAATLGRDLPPAPLGGCVLPIVEQYAALITRGIWTAIQPKRLLCNEVVRKRIKILIANLKRCGAMDAVVLSQDPSVLAQHLPQSAQLVLVDAPCSGQSLLAKGQAVPGCFHKVTMNRNANRQKRILANAAQLVLPGGYLLYSTCTYAPDENEQVGHWLLKKFPDLVPVTVESLHPYQSPLTDMPCYRLWPQSGLGAGAFALLLRRTGDAIAPPLNEDFLSAHQFVLYPQ